MKLSKVQQSVLDEAKEEIDTARRLDYPEWLKLQHIPDHRFQKALEDGYLKHYWENNRKSVVLTQCNSRTIKKLEELGLIEIIEDSNGHHFGIDTIKVLNY